MNEVRLVDHFALRKEELDNLREICAPALEYGASLAQITGYPVLVDQEVPAGMLRVVGSGSHADYPLNWMTLDALLRPWNQGAKS